MSAKEIGNTDGPRIVLYPVGFDVQNLVANDVFPHVEPVRLTDGIGRPTASLHRAPPGMTAAGRSRLAAQISQ